jgi:hypothetical protein
MLTTLAGTGLQPDNFPLPVKTARSYIHGAAFITTTRTSTNVIRPTKHTAPITSRDNQAGCIDRKNYSNARATGDAAAEQDLIPTSTGI